MAAFFKWWQAMVAVAGASAAAAALLALVFTSVATPSVKQDDSALFLYGSTSGQ